MRRSRHVLVLAVALAAIAALPGSRTARAGTFDEFRVPEHHALQWTGSLSGSAGWGSGFQDLREEWSGSGQTDAVTQASGLAESEAGLATWSAAASAGGHRSHDLQHSMPAGPASWMSQEQWAHDLSESFALGGTLRWWPSRGPAHGVVAATATGDYGQAWSWTRLDRASFAGVPPLPIQRSEEKTERRTWSHLVSASAGLGIGRARDVTGAYEARLLEDRLREAGGITRPLAAATRRDLAALMTVRQDVESAHERPAAAVWGEIHRILSADGALRDPALAADEWFRLAEPWFGRSSRVDAAHVPVSPVLRLRGWTLEARVEGRTGQSVARFSSDYAAGMVGDDPGDWYLQSRGARDATCQDRGVAGLAGEAHWPLGMRVQADASGSALADLRPGQHGIEQHSAASAGWMAAPRWLVTLRFAQSRTCFSGTGTSLADDVWAVQYGTTAEYAVTDHIDARLDFVQTHARTGLGALPVATRWELDHKGSLTFGLSYRFAGRASAPGMFPAGAR